MTDARVSGIGTKVLRKNSIPDTRVSGVGVKVLIGSRSLLTAQIKGWNGSAFTPATMKVWDSATSSWKTYTGYVYDTTTSTWKRFQ